MHAEAGDPARIIAKLNSLVDPHTISMLYRASQAGVRIDLIIRGTCCLRPGVPGVEHRVASIVDRHLAEHSSYFQNGDEPEVFLASADWMPRNFRRRVEIMFPSGRSRRWSASILGVVSRITSRRAASARRDLPPGGSAGPGEPTPSVPSSSSRTWRRRCAKPARVSQSRIRSGRERVLERLLPF